MLTVWGRRSSFNVQKVMWLVDELALPYRHIDAGGKFGGLDSDEFRRMNPHGKIPVIKDDVVTVWDSHAILRYLAALHGKPNLWRDDPIQQAQIDSWMNWSQTVLQPDFLVGIFWGFYRTPADQRNPVAIERSIALCAAHFQLLNTILADRPFLLGNALTVADIATGTSLYRYFNLDIDRPRIPNVEAWYQRLQQRDGYQKNVMVSFESQFGRLDY